MITESSRGRPAAVVDTVNEPDDMRRLVDLGVDGAFTNFPDRFDAVLGDRAASAGRAASEAAQAWRRCTQRR